MSHAPFNVLLAISEREETPFVFNAAAEILSRLGSYDLNVMTVLDPSVVPTGELEREHALDEAEDRMCQVTTRLVTNHQLRPRVAISHVAVGSPAHEILQAARNLEIQLILLGNHGAGINPIPVIGTVATQVVREAPCPVLVLPAEPPEEVAAKSQRTLEPVCERCLEARRGSGGAVLWCSDHTDRAYRDTYFEHDRVGEFHPAPSQRPLHA